MKKTFSATATTLIIIVFCAIGCSKNNEKSLAAGGTGAPPVTTPACDTANMKYAADVVPVLQASCYSCHGSSSSGGSGGIVLDNYASLKNWADKGYLVGTITHATGYVAMPYGQAKLDDCSINKIISWVNNGKQNN